MLRTVRRRHHHRKSFSTDSTKDARSNEAISSGYPYNYVRKLIVGLGNPGNKFIHTRCRQLSNLLTKLICTQCVFVSQKRRHNIGFVAVEHFLETYVSRVTGKHVKLRYETNNYGRVAQFQTTFQQNAMDKSYLYPVDDLVNLSSKRAKERTLNESVPHDEVNVALLLPMTYMNCSGTAVRAFMQSHRWRLKRNPLALNRQDELLVIMDDVSMPFGECRFKAKGGPGGQNGVRDIIKCIGTERFARLRIGVGAPHWFQGGNTGAPSGTAIDKFVLERFNGDEQEAMPNLLCYVNELVRLYLHRGVARATTYANSMDLEKYLKQYGASPINRPH
ncbi:hypothetical protein PsorP6_005343 [Peronosclerospora sorghi]|uniref:Uncharacterized protein n=1 Tax=Peronosclerospora sorghi TaxID=230839 RepID=A0ACC0W4I6_9STRA|nr:hypothetical protein PsorP6_005343 [Peronosclerospora sorghi]